MINSTISFSGTLMPITIQDPLFGTLIQDQPNSDFEGQTVWMQAPVAIQLSVDQHNRDASLQEALKNARTLWQDQSSWMKRIHEKALSKLLKLKNDSWRDDDEEIETPESFCRKMQLQTICVTSEASFFFTFGDGGLFDGHWINVSGTLVDGPKFASFEG
jgi:hypothetical protein